MKFGFCMLLWTTSVGESHRALLEDIQATGYDGVELPMFEGTPNDYAAVERMPGGIGPGRTADSVIPSVDKHPLGEDPAVRSTAVDYLKSCVDCPAALAADSLDDPLHQTLGHFPGSPLTEAEFERAREFHGEVGNYAAASQVTIALEAVNRFESYFATAMDQLGSFVANLGHLAIRAMYDTFRANIDEADPIVASSRNSEHLVHVHISKSDRGYSGARACTLGTHVRGTEEREIRPVAYHRGVRAGSSGTRGRGTHLARRLGFAGSLLPGRLPLHARGLGRRLKSGNRACPPEAEPAQKRAGPCLAARQFRSGRSITR